MDDIQQKTQSTLDHSQPEHQDKPRRTFLVKLIIDLLYSLTKTTLVITVFVLLRSLNLPTLTASHSYLRTQQNLALWQTQVIVDLRVTSGYNCPHGYERFSTYQWPGTIEGCACAVKLGVWDYTAVLEGRCNQRQFAKGCQSVPAYPALPFLFWKPKAQLCLKRLQNYTFYSSFTDIKNASNYTVNRCAAGTDHEIDLISAIPCPLTDMRNDSSLGQTIPELGLAYTRQSEYPIAVFKIAEYQFCQDFNEDAVSPGRHSNYILEKRLRSECNTSDARVILIDQQTEPDLFMANSRINNIISTLPSYPLPDDHYQYLFGFVRYPAWKYSCRSNSLHSLTQARDYLNLTQITQWFNTSQILLTALLSLAIILVLGQCLDHYLHLRAKHQHGYLYLKDYEIQKINPRSSLPRNRSTETLKFLFVLLFSVCTLAALSVFHNLCAKAYNWYASAAPCTDTLFQSYLLTYQQYFGSAMATILASAFVTGAWIFTDTCYLLWRMCKGDLEEETVEEMEKVDIRDVSSMISDEKASKIMSLTEECMIDNTYQLEDTANKATLPGHMEFDFSIAQSSSYSSNSSDSQHSVE